MAGGTAICQTVEEAVAPLTPQRPRASPMEVQNQLNGMGTWRRYKLGQAQFTSWLKQTAEKLLTRKNEGARNEDEADGNADSTTPQQSRRQKKKAKSAGSSIGITFDTGAGKFVHWSQLEVLAQRVVDNATPDDVPVAALNILRDVVSLRKKSFSFFSSSAKDTDDEKLKQSNANHAHIISVLERVLARLEALVNAGGGSQRRPKSTDNSRVNTSDLSNMFAFLELQTEPDTADDAAADQFEEEAAIEERGAPQKPGKKKGGKKMGKPKKHGAKSERVVTKAKNNTSWVDKFRFGLPGEEEEEDEFDLYMMVYCFFEDFNTIRSYIAERWCDYWYDRSVPLDTLAVVTNAAFELFHQLEYDLVRELRPLSPELARYDFMMSMLFYHYGIDHIDYDSYDDLTEDEQDERIWRDESDWLALPSHFTLQRTLEMIPPGKVPMLAPSQRSPTVYGARTPEEWKSFETLVTNQIIIEGAHLKALKVNQQEPPVLPTESLLLLDFQDCLKRNSYNSALIFSLHLWVDIRNIMESDHDKPFEELKTTATKLKEALEKHNPNKYRKDHDFKRAWIGRLWETKHYMVEDFLFEDKKARFRQIGMQEDPEPFFLLRHEPVWAGLLDFRAKLVYSQLGHEFVLLSSIVDAAACLYHAARAADPDLPHWDDMDKYVDTHQAGSRDGESAAAIIHKYAESRGRKSAQREKATHPADSGRPNAAVAVRQSLYQRYAFDERRAPFVDYLGELTTQRLQIERTERQGARNTLALLHTNTTDAGEEIGDGTLTIANGVAKATDDEVDFERDSELSQLSPIKMLELLDETVTSQVEGLLTLDYFKLFDESAALLEAVVGGFGPDMESRLGPHNDESPARLEQLPILLSQDLQDSQGSEQETDIINTVAGTCWRVLQGLV
ncbi:hypothetical protein CHGG_10150 [Chaetomium globosum CBS 148.51]|uniref:DUF6604 domain-containing protein n=1 Tax=Chaetomium globosum (strain ATCC 6205 / CBS 148.51 / DSM 1962 / NBRC 6347 / NRRL 1970) TaxID=306901 RepID=Q2GPF4_CHAGB|nr:uncharacterized protein CHGG_10150 [Chaetomium globosum CBS 148.51]EAQ83746.1 hypothetical protein CHGG_10150 [Chaetomium globosum CBS 148.51]